MIILYILSIVIFFAYIFDIVIRFGIPESISESAYLYRKNGKMIFYVAMCAIALPLLMFWLDITDDQPYQFLVYLSCASLCFVGISGDFRHNKQDNRIHIISVIIAIICSQVWTIVTLGLVWMCWYLFIILMAAIGDSKVGVKRNVRGELYYTSKAFVFFAEIAIFVAMYFAIGYYYLNR